VTASATSRAFSAESFEAFLAERREPDWLVALRREAWAAFETMSWPDRSLEEWMRTDIRGFRLDQFVMPGGGGAEKKWPVAGGRWLATSQSPNLQVSKSPNFLPLLVEGVELAGRDVAVDSRASGTSLDPELARRGVLFGSLDELIVEHGDLLRPHLFAAVDYHADRFAALHAACWSGGTLLYVPKGVVVDRPLHVFSALTPGGVDLGHSLVILDDGAEATLLAETASAAPAEPAAHASEGAAGHGLHCGAVEIHVGPRARLRYVNLQNWGTGVWHFAHQRALVGRDASLQWTIGALGSRLAKVNQHVELVGPGAHAEVNGVMFTEGRQHLSYHTLQHHRAPHCTSDLLYKGALQDRSRLVWRGMIKVDRDAQRTDGYQRDDNLILSEEARADSIPGLEIEADDVKCSHGATAGRVDDEQVFYARCRGLTRREATRMIVAGFFQQVFDRIPIANVRHALGEAIGRRVREYD
jgi:Fe-S cluster assembly protein SufD